VSYYDETSADLKYAWGEACVPVSGVGIAGPQALPVGWAGSYTATYTPPTATLPVTFTWDNGTLGPTAVYSWTIPGAYTVTVTGTNVCGGEAVGHLPVRVLLEWPYRVYLPLVYRGSQARSRPSPRAGKAAERSLAPVAAWPTRGFWQAQEQGRTVAESDPQQREAGTGCADEAAQAYGIPYQRLYKWHQRGLVRGWRGGLPGSPAVSGLDSSARPDRAFRQAQRWPVGSSAGAGRASGASSRVELSSLERYLGERSIL